MSLWSGPPWWWTDLSIGAWAALLTVIVWALIGEVRDNVTRRRPISGAPASRSQSGAPLVPPDQGTRSSSTR